MSYEDYMSLQQSTGVYAEAVLPVIADGGVF